MYGCSYLTYDKEGAGPALRAGTRAFPNHLQVQRTRSYADLRCIFAQKSLYLCNREQWSSQCSARTKQSSFYEAIQCRRTNV